MIQTVLLGDVINIRSGKSRPKLTGDYPVYGGNGIFGSAPTSNISGPAIIIGRVGAYCGSIHKEKKDFWLSDNALGVTAKEVADLDYLYYLLGFINLNHQAVGGAQPLLTQGIINNISICLPDLETQNKIANILDSLNEKIELNRKMNETLEQMGQLLFRHYFVDNVEVDGWEKKALGDILDLRGGLSYKAHFLSDDITDMPMVTMGCVSGKFRINIDAIKRYNGEYSEHHILNTGDIFIATRDVTQDRVLIGSPAIVPKILGKAICATNLYKVVLKQDISTEFLYQLMRTKRYREQIIANAKGSTIVMLTKDSVLNYTFSVDFDSDTYSKYVKVAEVIRQKIDKNSEVIQTLTILRDTLLPRLMNGKIKL